MNSEIRKMLEGVRQGTVSVDDALLALKKEPFTDIGYAKVDLHRGIRQGAAEVIYGAGKTPAQMIGIIGVMRRRGQRTILITRLSPEAAQEIAAAYPLDYHEDARCGIIGTVPEPDGIGRIVGRTQLELPLFYEDFTLLGRDLELAAQTGLPVDLSAAIAAAKKAARREDDLVLNGNKALGVDGLLTVKG